MASSLLSSLFLQSQSQNRYDNTQVSSNALFNQKRAPSIASSAEVDEDTSFSNAISAVLNDTQRAIEENNLEKESFDLYTCKNPSIREFSVLDKNISTSAWDVLKGSGLKADDYAVLNQMSDSLAFAGKLANAIVAY